MRSPPSLSSPCLEDSIEWVSFDFFLIYGDCRGLPLFVSVFDRGMSSSIGRGLLCSGWRSFLLRKSAFPTRESLILIVLALKTRLLFYELSVEPLLP